MTLDNYHRHIEKFASPGKTPKYFIIKFIDGKNIDFNRNITLSKDTIIKNFL